MSILAANPCRSKSPTIFTLDSLDDFDWIKQPNDGDIAVMVAGGFESFWVFESQSTGEPDGYFTISGGCQGAWVGSTSEINVMAFGADPTGDTCSTEAVQRAHDLLPDTGGTIVFPEPPPNGFYEFNLVVTKRNVHIKGFAQFKPLAGFSVSAQFVPCDKTIPLIQVGNDTGYVNGFRMSDCSLSGGNNVGPFGAVGIYFAGGAVECFLNNVSVTNFDVGFDFQNGSAWPCSLIWIDNFSLLSSPNANARGIRARWLDTGSYTTAIYFNNGHINGPLGATSYAIEVDGTFIFMSNVYADVEIGNKGVKLAWTASPGAHTPYIGCSNFNLDSLDQNAVVVDVTHSNNTIWSDWLKGTARVVGKLRVMNGTEIAGPDGSFMGPVKGYYAAPAVYGTMVFLDGTDTSWNEDLSMQRVGTDLTIANTKVNGDINLNPTGELNITPLGQAIRVIAGILGFDNNFGIEIESSTGVSERVLLLSAANNLQLLTPTQGGGMQVIGRHASSSFQFLPGGGTIVALELDNSSSAGSTRLLIYDITAAASKRVKLSEVGSLPVGAKVLYVDP